MFCRVVCGQVDKVLVYGVTDMEPEGKIKIAMKALYDTLNDYQDSHKDILALDRWVTLQFRDYPNIEDENSAGDTEINLSNLLTIWVMLRERLGLRRGEMPW